jgi:hypothetical protein
MRKTAIALLLFASVGLGAPLDATIADSETADRLIAQFLAQDDSLPAYRGIRRLEAANGKRTGWLEAATEFSPATGFRYEVTAEGGSDYIRTKVLKAVLEGEREAMARGEAARAALARENYRFHATGVEDAGLATVILSPRRKERYLVDGKMFLQPDDGRLVRLQGQLAKSPSVWIKNVEIVRSYERIAGAVVPVALESKAQLRFLGSGTLRMTYLYSEVDGRVVSPSPRP